MKQLYCQWLKRITRKKEGANVSSRKASESFLGRKLKTENVTQLSDLVKSFYQLREKPEHPELFVLENKKGGDARKREARVDNTRPLG